MKKLIPLLIFLFALPVMAGVDTLWWRGNAAGSEKLWSEATNWGQSSGATNGWVPTDTDVVKMNADDEALCSLDVAGTCLAILAGSDFTAGFKQGAGHKLTVKNRIVFDGACAVNFADTVQMDGDGIFHIGTDVTSISTAGWINPLGNDTLDFDEVTMFAGANGAPNGKQTTIIHSSASGSKILALGTGIFQIDASCIYEMTFTASSQPIVTTGIPNITGTGTMRISYTTGSARTLTLDTINTVGSLTIRHNTGGTGALIVNQVGKIWVGGNVLFDSNLGGSSTFNMDGSGLKVTGAFSPGALNTFGTFTLNCSTSICTVGIYNHITYQNNGTNNINLASSQWVVLGSKWQNGSAVTLDAGTSSISLEPTVLCSLISNGAIFYDVKINGAAKPVKLIDSLNISNDLNDNAGILNQNNQNLRIGGDLTYAAGNSDSLILGDTINMTGNGDFALRGTGKIIGANTSIWHAGTGNWDFDVTPFTTLNNCSLAYATKTITNTGAAGAYAFMNGKCAIGQGILANNGNWVQTCDSANPITCAGTINGSGDFYFNSGVATKRNFPALTFANTGSVRFIKQAATVDTINHTGALVTGGNTFYYNNADGASMQTFTNDNAITTTGTMYLGNNSGATRTTVFNFGASSLTFVDWNALFNASGIVFNIGKEGASTNWTLKNSFTWQSSATVNYTNLAQDTFTYTTNSADIASNGKAFPTLIFNQATKTFKPLDNLQCFNLKVLAGIFDQNAKAIRASGDVLIGGTGNHTLNNWITLTADNKKFSITTTGSALGMASCTLSVQDHDTLYFDDSQYDQLLPIGRLIVGDGDTLMFTSGDSMTIAVVAAGDWSGSTFRTTSAGNPVYISAPAGVTVTSMDVMDNFNRGTAITATDASNLNRGGNTGWNFSYAFDTTYRDTTYDSACLSLDTLQAFSMDTLQVDSISGTYDTTLNWKRVARFIDTTWFYATIDTTTDPAGDSIALTISACNGDTTARDTFYVSAPTISSISPSKGSKAGGRVALVLGSNFGASQGAGTINLGTVSLWKDDSIRVLTNAHAKGLFDVIVLNNAGGRDTLVYGYKYTDDGTGSNSQHEGNWQ